MALRASTLPRLMVRARRSALEDLEMRNRALQRELLLESKARTGVVRTASHARRLESQIDLLVKRVEMLRRTNDISASIQAAGTARLRCPRWLRLFD